MGLQATEARKTSTMLSRNEVIQTLDYLGRELSGLDRMVIAAEEMVLVLHTDWPQCDAEIQEKIVHNISVAKETLMRHEISVRPFVSCGQDLIPYRNAYFAILTAATELISNIRNDETRLNLRRLTLPLNSMRRFSVRLDNRMRSVGVPRETCAIRKSKHHKTQQNDIPPNIPAVVVPSTQTPQTNSAEITYVPNVHDYPSQYLSSEDSRNGSPPEAVDQLENMKGLFHSQSGGPQETSRALTPALNQYAYDKTLEIWRHRNLGAEFESYLNSGETFGFDWFMRNPPNGIGSAGSCSNAYGDTTAEISGGERASTRDIESDPTCTIM